MILVKTEVNYKIDWHGDDREFITADEQEKRVNDRKHYFDMLRRVLIGIDTLLELGPSETLRQDIRGILEKYNIHFVDIDDIPRVNIDEPK